MSGETIYRDPTDNNFPIDYDFGKVDSRIKLRTTAIRTKMYGKDVRGAMAEAAELSGVVSREAKDASELAQKAGAEATTAANNISRRFDNQIAGSTYDNEVIDARMSADGRTYTTLGTRLNDMPSNDDLAAVDRHFEESTILSPVGSVRPVFRDALDTIHEEVSDNLFNLAVLTDAHWEENLGSGTYPYAAYSLNHLANLATIDDAVDAMVLAGDNNHSDSADMDNLRNQLKRFSCAFFDATGKKSDKFELPGNHDDGSQRIARGDMNITGYVPGELLTDEEFKSAYRTADLSYGEVRDSGSLYFYKDYPQKKIRLIGLDSVDTNDSLVDDSGYLKYPRLQIEAYRQAQLAWLANVALQGVPADYHTLVVTHYPTTLETQENLTVYNADLLNKLLAAFISGSSVQLDSNTTDFTVSLQADFTSQGPRVFVGVLVGHLHKEGTSTAQGAVNNYWLINSIADGNRVPNTVQEDGWTIASVDVSARKLYLHGFGAGTEREFTY